MMKSRTRSALTATAAALTLSLALTACGGSGSDDGTNADGSKQLTFMFRGGEDEKAAYTEAIKQFEAANEGVKVNMIVTTADEYATKLQAAITGRQIPDVFYVEPGQVQSLATSGVVMDLTEKVEGSDVIDLDNIWEYGVDSYRFDGSVQGEGAIYALPKDIGPFSFGYNKTMFEEAGIELPDVDTPYTLDEFVQVAKELTQDTDGDGELDQWGTGLNVTWNLQAFVWGNGGDWINEVQDTVTVDTPEFAEALQWFADLQNVHGTTPSVEQAQTLDTYQRWMQGEIGFFPVGPWDVSTYNELDFEWDLIPYPSDAGTPATWIGTLGIAASNSTKHPDEAVELVEYLVANVDAQQTLVDAGVQIPNLIDMADEWVADTESKPANKQEFLDVARDYGRALPANNTYSAQWYDEFFVNIQPVLDGDQTAAEYVKEVQPKMQVLLDEAIAASQNAGS